jgi:hypothetical protein
MLPRREGVGMRRAKTTRPVAAKGGKVSKVAPTTAQLNLDFEGRAVVETPKTGAKVASRRQARRTVLGIPEKPKS